MFIKKLFFLFVLFFSIINNAQKKIELTPLSKVSVLTIGTEEELSSKFGHSAFRIQDPTLGIDVTYNYGMFDFNAPNFYLKFTTGKLPYRLARHSFENFMYSYKIENRWVKEQTLNLNLKEKNTLLQFLENNLLPENKYYKYDFLFDNCATKIPEVLKKITNEDLKPSNSHLKKESTFRQLIHESLDTNEWSTFGIDLALGSVIDIKATSKEHLFLPIYVYHQLENTSKKDNTPLVSKTEMILKTKAQEKNNIFLLSPFFWFGLLFILVTLLTIKDYSTKKRTKWLDTLLFFSTGIAGLLILFLWFGTDHNATARNFNILWAFPLNLYVAFVLRKKSLPDWIKIYLITLLSLILISLFIWAAKIQVFSIILIFILLSLVIRYLYLLFHLRRRND
ncbi:DUF4105 domain-containing protein [uncultured Maribacter sp.]|uniref:lipoprotein N-acyltransferase Lnb domain-containing protein n=1 Tax=uncultured Maribacter sp. TaxID=431308 RepID=UPI002611ADA6|nr:DUF4105 domain-containing protein [uncultured Maribacter sp.]